MYLIKHKYKSTKSIVLFEKSEPENYDYVIVDLFCLLFSSKITRKTGFTNIKEICNDQNFDERYIGWTSPYFNELVFHPKPKNFYKRT